MAEDKPGQDLSKLRIDRASQGPSSRRVPWLALGVGVVAVGLLAVLLPKITTTAVSDTAVQTYRVTYTSGPGSSALLSASGYVVAQRQADVSSKATGRLVYLGVEEGDQVKEGDVLGQVESRDVEAEQDRARANLDLARGQKATAEARLKEARLSFDRVNDLLSRKLVSQSEFDRADAALSVAVAEREQSEAAIAAAQAALRAAAVAVENTLIRAPFDGTVLTKTADVGEMVAPFGSAQSARGAVVTLADMTSLEVEADVSESNIQRVKVGAPAEIILDAYPGRRYKARVKKIVPTADRAKATVLTKVRFLDKDERVLPEMSAKVTFLEEGGESAGTAELTVPVAAIVQDGAQSFVFTLIGDRARRVAVVPGDVRGSQRVIQSGLREGEQVIVSPPEGLKDGDRVKTS